MMFRSHPLRTLTSTSNRSRHYFQETYNVPKEWFSAEREEVSGGGMSLSEVKKMTSTSRRINHFPETYTAPMRWLSAEAESPEDVREEVIRSRMSSEAKKLTSTSRLIQYIPEIHTAPMWWYSAESKSLVDVREEFTGGRMSLSEVKKLTSTSRRSRHFLENYTAPARLFSVKREEVIGGGMSMSEAKKLTSTSHRSRHFPAKYTEPKRWFSEESKSPAAEREEVTGGGISLSEAKKLMRLVNVEALKEKLVEEGKEVISYDELLKSCESFGVARSIDEAKAFVSVLDDAGVVLLFRDKVFLHPDKVVDLVKRSVPLALTPEDDPRREELKKLQERKEEIDKQAHKEVRVILWLGLGVTVSLVGLFFRLTFWEFSWDVMEPIAFFTTTTGIVIGYTYFMFTAKDPSYQDLMQTMFFSRQRKLMKRYKFDLYRFQELREKCKTP